MTSAMLLVPNQSREVAQELDNFQYADDLSEDTVLVTPFEVYPSSLGELAGGDEDGSIDPESICEEEGETYSSMITNTRVRAALKRPVRLCKYAGVPVCLMILEIELSQSKLSRQMPRILRFKSVEITAEFKDAQGKSKLGPQIAIYCPETLASSSAIPVGPYIEVEKAHSRQFWKSSHVEITGRAPRMGQRTPIVQWDVKEDDALKKGVPSQLRLAVAVKNPDERPFNIKLNFTAYLGFNLVEFRVKKKESVLSTRVDPKLLREQALNDQFGQQHGQLWVCRAEDLELTALTREELNVKFEGLTNLKGSTVGTTSAGD